MKTVAVLLALTLLVMSCRAGADVTIVNRVVIDEKTLIKLLSKPRQELKQKIKVQDRFLNCDLGGRIAWAYLTNQSLISKKGD